MSDYDKLKQVFIDLGIDYTEDRTALGNPHILLGDDAGHNEVTYVFAFNPDGEFVVEYSG